MTQETLDPGDWQEFRALAHEMVDDILDHLQNIEREPAWQKMPDEVRESFQEALPHEGIGEKEAYRRFVKEIRPYTNGNRHPRFWGWVHGNGTPLGMMADMLASGINPHVAGYDQAPKLVELQVLEWMRQLMGFPEGTEGLLVSGGTMANVTALAIARNARGGFDVRQNGLQESPAKLRIYGSTETHGWVAKAAGFLGLGIDSFHPIPVDDRYQINVEELEKAVEEDRAKGERPFFVIGTAGTVNTGATDDLNSLADFCYREDLWFHIDGAFGALAKASPELEHIVAGLERADSVAFDLHKWMYLPFDIACVLIREGGLMEKSFSQRASYLAQTQRGVVAGGFPLAERGIELSRSFKALKAWMNLQAYGLDKFGRVIYQNVQQARYLASLIEKRPELELLAPVDLNVVCFRYRADNKVNEEIIARIQEQGIAVPSSTDLDGKFAIRCAITNHRSRFEDFDLLVEAVIRIGGEILRG